MYAMYNIQPHFHPSSLIRFSSYMWRRDMHSCLNNFHLMAEDTFSTRLKPIWGIWKIKFFCFYRTCLCQSSILSNNDQVHIIMTVVSYLPNEHHSACSSLNRGGGEKTIMSRSSKLCLLIALLLDWLLMDITFCAVSQATVCDAVPFETSNCVMLLLN